MGSVSEDRKDEGGFVAKKSAKKTPKEFLKELATDPVKLGKFILDPEGAMNEAKITAEKDRTHVKNSIAHFASEKLVKPDAYTVIDC